MPRYSGDPREMTARFASTCAESGNPIKKGDPIIYYPNGKKAFLVGSAPKTEQNFREQAANMADEDNGMCCW